MAVAGMSILKLMMAMAVLSRLMLKLMMAIAGTSILKSMMAMAVAGMSILKLMMAMLVLSRLMFSRLMLSRAKTMTSPERRRGDPTRGSRGPTSKGIIPARRRGEPTSTPTTWCLNANKKKPTPKGREGGGQSWWRARDFRHFFPAFELPWSAAITATYIIYQRILSIIYHLPSIIYYCVFHKEPAVALHFFGSFRGVKGGAFFFGGGHFGEIGPFLANFRPILGPRAK